MFTPGGESLPLTTEQGSASLGCFDAIDKAPDSTCNLEALFDNLLAATFDRAGTNLIISGNVQRGHFEPFISRKSFPLFWGVFPAKPGQTGSKPEKTFRKPCVALNVT